MKLTLALSALLIPANAFFVAPNARPNLFKMLSTATDYETMSEKELRNLIKIQNGGGMLSKIKLKLKNKEDLVGMLHKDDVAPQVSTFSPKAATAEEFSIAKPFSKVNDVFPGALTNAELVDMVNDTIEKAGYDKKKTLVATSLCVDEISRPLEADLASEYDTTFHMGGLAGFPFGGATSFGAMASHIPDGGSCVIVHGPHVGVDSTGAVGTVERRGRANGGACCGSAVAASNYVAGVYSGDAEAPFPEDALDAQQYFVGASLVSHAERLEKARSKMVELPYALIDEQSTMMKKIVTTSAGAVAGDGNIAVLGGIQINTPPGFSDYYLPISFELYNNKGEKIDDFLPKSSGARSFDQIKSTFPGALRNAELTDKVSTALEKAGYDLKKTLVATSLCVDEVSRPLENDFASKYDTTFNMGGLAGFPFGGATAFGAMASHIPDDGSCVVVYGPHVGVDASGTVGTVSRRGRENGGACCGSAVAASNYVSGVYNGGDKAPYPEDPFDAMQYFVGSMLMPHAERLEGATDKMTELPYALYDAQTTMVKQIVDKSAGAVAGDGKIAVLGGIQVNTPVGYSDYYLPLSFDLYNNKGEKVDELKLD